GRPDVEEATVRRCLVMQLLEYGERTVHHLRAGHALIEDEVRMAVDRLLKLMEELLSFLLVGDRPQPLLSPAFFVLTQLHVLHKLHLFRIESSSFMLGLLF